MNQCVLDTSNEAIAKRLGEAMRDARISNAVLAGAAGVTIQAVGDWLRSGKIARENVPAICGAIGRSADWLLTGASTLDDAVAALPEEARKEVFSFVLYKIEKSTPPYVSENAASYADFMERLIQDMKKRRERDGEK